MHEPMIDLMMRVLDREASDAERVRLQAHLTDCVACMHEWESLSLVHQRLASAPAFAPSANFTDRFRARLEAQHAVRPAIKRRQWVIGGAIGGAALVTAAIAVMLSLTDWLTPETWTQLLDSGLSMFVGLAAWIDIVMTFARVTLSVVGEGALVVFAALVLALTLVWVWLVSGSSRLAQITMVSGG